MNYAASPYIPNYAAPAQAYAQSPYDAYAYAQQQQLQQYAPDYYAMSLAGQLAPGAIVAAPAPTNPLQGAWWQEPIPMLNIPRWAGAAGVLALTGIGLAWKAGVFGGKSSSRSSSRTVRRTSRDATRPRTRSVTLTSTPSGGERDATRRSRSAKTRKRAGGTRRRRRSSVSRRR